ncbi:hypothetical protein VZT92_007788 [Zoarces viviparus]|uniref:Uncharacterized protein n=1 Tax=Zoarces viviparus TaxID=48416 RepID=A0AAW1FL27_ZOAVI
MHQSATISPGSGSPADGPSSSFLPAHALELPAKVDIQVIQDHVKDTHNPPPCHWLIPSCISGKRQSIEAKLLIRAKGGAAAAVARSSSPHSELHCTRPGW